MSKQRIQPKVLYAAIGRRVAAAREEHSPSLTQHELSNLTGGRLSRSAIANIESGRQRIAVHHLYELAAALSVSPEQFLPLIDEFPPTGIDEHDEISSDPAVRSFTEQILRRERSSFLTGEGK